MNDLNTQPSSMPAPQALTREQFIEAMSKVANSVSIVTTDGPAGKLGVTVSAFASLAADPPLVLCCINEASPSADVIKRNGRFAINVLAYTQQQFSECFAGLIAEGDGMPFAFDSADWTALETGAPILKTALSSFDCEVTQCSRHGSHLLIIGAVKAVAATQGEPLIYWARQYRQLDLE